MFKSRLIILILAIFIAFSFSDCFADSQINVYSEADKAEICLDEFLQFTVTIEGIGQSFGNPEIRLPQIEDDFNIIATSQSNNIDFESGQMQMVWQVRYTLLPKKEGRLKINSTEIIYEGKSYKTEEINITVKPAKNPQQNIPQQPQPRNVPWSKDEGISI